MLKKDPNIFYKQLAKSLDVSSELVLTLANNQELNVKKKVKKGYMSNPVSLKSYYNSFLNRYPSIKNVFRYINKGPLRLMYRKVYNLLDQVKLHQQSHPYLTVEQRKKIGNEFKNSNRYLSKKYDLNLEEFGY